MFNNKKGDVLNIVVLGLLVVALSGALISGPEITGYAIKDTCFEGTEYGKCSFVKPKYCDGGALKPNCQECGCPASQVCLENGNCIPKCNDGTLFGKCSENQPLYCFKGSLLENCHKCGCYEGGTCEADGKCSGIRIIRCEDGTAYNRCSADKPKYCIDGELVDKCGFCGCPDGKYCDGDLCVERGQEVIVESPKEVFKESIDDSSVAESEKVSESEKEEKDLKWFLQWFCDVLRLKC